MKRHLRTAAMVAVLGLAGCGERRVEATWSNASGSVALSRDDSLVYVVDADNGILAVVDAARREKVGEVKVGLRPERVVVGPDDTVYVSNRAERSVSVVRRGEWTEAARIPVSVEPTGLSVSPDGDTLYVVNSTALDSTAHGTLTAIDTRSLATRWELPVGEEPRGIALLDEGRRAVLSLFRQGDVVSVDLSDAERPRLTREGTDLLARANRVRANASDPGSDTTMPGGVGSVPHSFRARGMADVVSTPDGRRLFAPMMWARADPLVSATPTPNQGGGSLYGGGTPCNATGGGVVTPGLITFESDDARPVVDELNHCGPPPGETPDFPPTMVTSPQFGNPIQGPAAAVVDPSGSWLFLVNRETDNVAILPTNRRTGDDLSTNSNSSVRQLLPVGSGPTGIAITRDGKRAYVYNAFDHTLSTLVSGGTESDANVREEGPRLALAGELLAPEVVAGRRLFFSALDSRMTSPTVSVSCGSCHLEGREDGHVWGFPDGPRQTPSLAGRMTTSTSPFHWSGEFPTLREFMNATVRQRMGGSSLDATLVAQLGGFIDTIPAADNPYKHAAPSAAQARGAQVFLKAGCGTCHEGAALTNNKNANVGTFVTVGLVRDDAKVISAGLNTPSLLGLARTAPYLHDGSAATLRERLEQGRTTNAHGQTADLNSAELDDLVEYLQTL
ncbi:c-type cytochrome [Corallococcus sp. M34]|uniref:c-type cytochrome n=1 Tax=Citreicoccus inhibens TaxID=2849499 RepID=UPI001C234100|nr:c-type cytochrome [Citreicoccus inhibens]MBU8894430.1 c-type cytochrome [Citreicoccus inhibens]